MSITSTLVGVTVVSAAALTAGVVTIPELVRDARGAATGTGLVYETQRVGDALATESESARPTTLTCVPDIADPTGLPCASFVEWDGAKLSGQYLFTLRQDPTLGLVLTGAGDGQVVEYALFEGGLQDTSGIDMPTVDSFGGLS